MYGDFDIDPFGYMVSQIDPTQYVTVYGAKTATKTLVPGLLKELVPVDNSGSNSGFSLSGAIIPMILVVGGFIVSKLFKNN